MMHHIDCLGFMRGMVKKGERVDAIITDPPYLYLNHKLDRKFNEREFFELASKITDKIVFFGRGDSFYKWNLLCAEFGFEFKEEIIWDKGKIASPLNQIGRCHETISFRCKKGHSINRISIPYKQHIIKSRDWNRLFSDFQILKRGLKDTRFQKWLKTGERFFEARKKKNNLSIVEDSMGSRDLQSIRCAEYIDSIGVLLKTIIRENNEQFKSEHPTQKPINLLRKLVLLISDKGDTIFDPFMGSGSTGVASLIEGRKFMGCEIDSEYFEIAKRRVEETDKTLRQSLFYGID